MTRRLDTSWQFPAGPAAMGPPVDRSEDPDLSVIDSRDFTEDTTLRVQVVETASSAVLTDASSPCDCTSTPA